MGGTIANPLYASLVPGMNPTGSQITQPQMPFASSFPGANPVLPFTNPSPSSAGPMNTNPFGAGFPSDASTIPGAPSAQTTGTTPTSATSTTTPPPVPGAPGGFPANGPGPTSLFPSATAPPQTNVGTAAASPIGGINLSSPKDLARLFGGLKSIYGDGIAHEIMNFLTTGAGFNQDAINNLFAAMQPQINRGEENILEQFSAEGGRFGSGAQIGLADYLSQVNLNEGQLETQMYEQAVQDYISVLTGAANTEAKNKANSPSIFDTIGGLAGLGGAGASGALAGLGAAGAGSGAGGAVLAGLAAI